MYIIWIFINLTELRVNLRPTSTWSSELLLYLTAPTCPLIFSCTKKNTWINLYYFNFLNDFLKWIQFRCTQKNTRINLHYFNFLDDYLKWIKFSCTKKILGQLIIFIFLGRISRENSKTEWKCKLHSQCIDILVRSD